MQIEAYAVKTLHRDTRFINYVQWVTQTFSMRLSDVAIFYNAMADALHDHYCYIYSQLDSYPN